MSMKPCTINNLARRLITSDQGGSDRNIIEQMRWRAGMPFGGAGIVDLATTMQSMNSAEPLQTALEHSPVRDPAPPQL